MFLGDWINGKVSHVPAPDAVVPTLRNASRNARTVPLDAA